MVRYLLGLSLQRLACIWTTTDMEYDFTNSIFGSTKQISQDSSKARLVANAQVSCFQDTALSLHASACIINRQVTIICFTGQIAVGMSYKSVTSILSD